MRRVRETCSVADCNREHHARDLCATHYSQFKRGIRVPTIRFNDDPAMLAKARSYVLRYVPSGITPARQTGPADDAQTDERLVHKD